MYSSRPFNHNHSTTSGVRLWVWHSHWLCECHSHTDDWVSQWLTVEWDCHCQWVCPSLILWSIPDSECLLPASGWVIPSFSLSRTRGDWRNLADGLFLATINYWSDVLLCDYWLRDRVWIVVVRTTSHSVILIIILNWVSLSDWLTLTVWVSDNTCTRIATHDHSNSIMIMIIFQPISALIDLNVWSWQSLTQLLT